MCHALGIIRVLGFFQMHARTFVLEHLPNGVVKNIRIHGNTRVRSKVHALDLTHETFYPKYTQVSFHCQIVGSVSSSMVKYLPKVNYFDSLVAGIPSGTREKIHLHLLCVHEFWKIQNRPSLNSKFTTQPWIRCEIPPVEFSTCELAQLTPRTSRVASPRASHLGS